MARKKSNGGEAAVRVDELKPHPRSLSIYGDAEDVSDLVQTYKDRIAAGLPAIQDALTVTPGHVVVIGTRRLRAAVEAGLETVPVVYVQYEDEAAELEALLTANQHRTITNEQRTRAAMAWAEVEAARAEQRMKAGKKADPSPNSDEGGETGRTDRIVAAKVGIGKHAYRNGATAVTMIDALKSKREPNPLAARGLSMELERSFSAGAAAAMRVADDLRSGQDDTIDLLRRVGSGNLNRLPNALKTPPPDEGDAAPGALPPPADRFDLYHGDPSKVGQDIQHALIPENAPTIMTDLSNVSAPWAADDGKALQGAARSVATFAAAHLPDGGSAFVMVEPDCLPEVLTVIGKQDGLACHAVYCARMPGAPQANARWVRDPQWRVVLHFYRKTDPDGDGGPTMHQGIADPIECPRLPKKARSRAAQVQHAFEYLAARAVVPGGLIVDPVMRSAAVGVAAIRRGRCFVGVAADKEVLDRAEKALDQAASQLEASPSPRVPAKMDSPAAIAERIDTGVALLARDLQQAKQRGTLHDGDEEFYRAAIEGMKAAANAIQQEDEARIPEAAESLRHAASTLEAVKALNHRSYVKTLRGWAAAIEPDDQLRRSA